MEYKKTILIQLPSMKTDLLRRLIKERNLVNISSLFEENGDYFDIIGYVGGNHVAATGAILTGKRPSQHNLHALPSFSYKQKKVVLPPADLTKKLAESDTSLYGIFKNPVNIFSVPVKTSSNLKFYERKRRNWFFAYAKNNRHWEMVDRASTTTLVKLLNKDHDFYHITYYGLHKGMKIYGNDNDRMAYALDLLDFNIGLIADRLKALKIEKETLIVMVGSRAVASANNRVDVSKLLSNKNDKLVCSSKSASQNTDAMVFNRDKALTQVYFREKGAKWLESPNPAAISERLIKYAAKMVDDPAIDQILVRTGFNQVKIVAKWGTSVLKWKQDKLFYEIIKGNDPFNLNNRKFTWSANESYDITRKSRYPDVIWQIREMFSHPNAGQMVVNGKRGFVFIPEKGKLPELTNGSLNTDHLLIPLLINTKNHSRIRRLSDLYYVILNATGKGEKIINKRNKRPRGKKPMPSASGRGKGGKYKKNRA